MIEDSPDTLPQTNMDATPSANNEPLPGPSKQITTHQESLQPWLSNIQNQLLFLSKIEPSNSFTPLVSILNSKKEDEKKCIEFLLALDNLSSKTGNILLPAQFFIKEEILKKNTRFLIDLHRDCSSQLISHSVNLDQVNFSEDLKNLQNRLQELKKEKNQLEKLQHPDTHITRLSELTRDFDKLKIEKCRDFKNEIGELEAKLETNRQELAKIKEIVEFNDKELLISDDQVEVESKFNQRKLFDLETDLHLLQKLVKQIDLPEINEVFKKLADLENTRLSLISEWENFDPIAILKKEIEEPNVDLEKLRSEKKITNDLSENIKKINVIIEILKEILDFSSIRSKDTSGKLLIKVESFLDIIADKRKLEAKTIKIAKLIKKTKPNDAVQALTAQYEMDKDLSNSIHDLYCLNQEELNDFLQKNNLELKSEINQLILLKENEITQLLNKKSILELITQKINLINKINALEEKIQVIKTEEYVFKLLKDHNILEELVPIERLQRRLENTSREIETLHKQIDEFEEKIQELQKDKDSSAVQNNKRKISLLENKKTQHFSNLNKLIEKHELEFELEKHLRDPIEKIINNIKKTQIMNCSFKLLQNEKSLRFNLRETTQLSKEIETLKNSALKNKQRIEIEAKQNQIENQLFLIIKESTKNSTTSPDNIFFEKLKTQLYTLKDQIENPAWNKSGWGFFYKKIPHGIQKLRSIFNENTFINFESEHNDDQKKLILLNLFSQINSLIDKKNTTSNFFRCHVVNDLYQSLQTSLNLINTEFFALRNAVAEVNENATQPTPYY